MYVDGIEHAITVAKLRELLVELKDDDVLYPNAVGNLSVTRGNEYIAYIDLGSEQVEFNDVLKTPR